jgi:hypothetical protein
MSGYCQDCGNTLCICAEVERDVRSVSVRNWINLTNGLQAIRDHGLTEYSVMRLQSTHCEQKRWGDVLASVPDEFLFRLAMGDECRVYDYGARKDVPRAVWQGLEWVRYAVTLRWTGEAVTPTGRARTMGRYFAEQYQALTSRETARLDYFGAMANAAPRISAVTEPTTHDGDKAWFVGCVRDGKGAEKNR